MKRTLLSLLVISQLLHAADPSEKALKYHQILQKRPSSGYVFDRFYDTWLDSATTADLEKFLKGKAASGKASDQLLLAYYHLRQGKELEAIKLYKNALKAKPGDPAISLQKAKLEARLLNFDGALKDLAAALPNAEQDLKTDIYHLQGRYLVRSGKPEEASKIWKSLLAKNPNNSDLIDSILETQLAEGLFKEALATSDLQIKNTRDPYKKVLRTLRRGDIYQRSGKRSQAIATYTSALDAVGQDSWLEREILAQIKEIFRREDNLEGLGKLYTELSKKHPQRMGIRKAHAHLLAGLGENDKAEALFREILKATPGNRKNQEELISILLKVGKNEAALTELKRLIKGNPKDLNLQLKLASVLHKAGKKDEIKAPLGEYLRLSNETPAAYLMVAGLLTKYELLEEAEETLRQSIGKHPESVECQGFLAKHLAEHDKKKEAIEIWKKMIATGKRDTVVRQTIQLERAGEAKLAYELLKGRVKDFGQDISYLNFLTKEALKRNDYENAGVWSMRILKLAKHVEELRQAVKLNAQTALKAETEASLTKSLAEKKDRIPVETWLLAELYELQGRSKEAVAALKTLRESKEASDQQIAAIAEVALYEYRGDWQNAAKATERMIALPKGKKPMNLRRLVEFYERLDQADEALKHIEIWKQTSPGDKTPWFKQADILAANGKLDEAITTLRRASQRFEDDSSFHAKLAGLYQDNDQNASAERLYWRLYEEAKTLDERLRWVPMLATVAEDQGRGNDLIARFEEKRKNNRKSIEPLFALAEIYRFNENYEERRKAMLEASRLRPNDAHILLTIAQTEEREGEVERALASLERAAEIDKSDRTKRALAQFYLRNDEVDKGISLIRELAGGKDASPRDLEKAAISIARSGEIEDALKLASDALTANPDDYRLAFLCAAFLSQDQRPMEAITQLMAALGMNKDLTGVKPLQSKKQWLAQFQQAAGYLRESQMYFLYDSYANRLITAPNKNNNRFGSSSRRRSSRANSSYSLPGSLYEKQPLIEGSIIALYSQLEEDEQKRLTPQLTAAGVKDVEYRAILSKSSSGNSGLRAGALKEYAREHADRKEVFYFPVMYECMQALYGRLYGFNRSEKIDVEFLEFAIKNAKSLSPYQQYSIKTILILEKKEKTTVADWEQVIAVAEKLKEDEILASSNFLALAMASQDTLPDKVGDKLLALATKWHWRPKKTKGPVSFYNQSSLGQAILTHYAKKGQKDKLLEFLEKSCAAHDKQKPSTAGPSMQAMMGFGGRGQSKFTLPEFPPSKYTGVPMIVQQMLKTEGDDGSGISFPRGQIFKPVDLGELELNKSLAKVKHPYLRIHIADAYDQADAMKTEIKAISSGDEPSLMATFYLAGYLTSEKKWAEASAVLAKARFLPIKRDDRKAIDEYLTALALSIQEAGDAEKQPAAIKEGQHAALRLRRSLVAPQDRQRLITALDDLGLQKEADLVASKSKPSPSSSASRFMSGNSSANSSDLKKLKTALTAGEKDKSERLALRIIKAHINQPNNWQKSSNQKEIRKLFKEHKLIDLVKKKLNPGDSTSLRRRATYAMTLYALGLNEEALPLMKELAKKGSKNRDLLISLTFMLPAKEKAEAAKHFEKALRQPSQNSYGGGQEIYMLFQQLENSDIEAWLNAQEFVAYYLSVAPKDDKKAPSLAWVQQCARGVINSAHVNGTSLPRLNDKDYAEEMKKDKKGYLKRRLAIAEKILTRSIERPELAAWAFPLYHSFRTGPSQQKKIERNLAVTALKNTALGQLAQQNQQNVFGFMDSSSSSDQKSALQFLVADAWATKNKQVFPKAVLDELRKEDKSLVVPLEFLQQTLFLSKADLEKAITAKISQKIKKNPSEASESAKAIAEICLTREHLSPALEKWMSDKWPLDDMQAVQTRLVVAQSTLPTYLSFLGKHDSSKVSPLIEKITRAIIQPDGDMAEFVKKNANRNSYTVSGKDPRFRISSAEQLLQAIGRGSDTALTIHTLRAMRNMKLSGDSMESISYRVTNFSPSKLDTVQKLVAQSGFGKAETSSDLVTCKFNGNEPNAFVALIEKTGDRIRKKGNSSWGIDLTEVQKALKEKDKLPQTEQLFLQLALLSAKRIEIDKQKLLLETLTQHEKTMRAWDSDMGVWLVNKIIKPTFANSKAGAGKTPKNYPKAMKSLIETLSNSVNKSMGKKFDDFLTLKKLSSSEDFTSLSKDIVAGGGVYRIQNRKKFIAVLAHARKLHVDFLEEEIKKDNAGSPYRRGYFSDQFAELEGKVLEDIVAKKHGDIISFLQEYAEQAKLPNISNDSLKKAAQEIHHLHSRLRRTSYEKTHLKELEKLVASYEKLPKASQAYAAVTIVQFMISDYRGAASIQQQCRAHFARLNKQKPSLIKQAIVVGVGANLAEHQGIQLGREAAASTLAFYRALPSDSLRNTLTESLAIEGGEIFCDGAVAAAAADALLKTIDNMDLYQRYSACRALHGVVFNNFSASNKEKFAALYEKLSTQLKSYDRRSNGSRTTYYSSNAEQFSAERNFSHISQCLLGLALASGNDGAVTSIMRKYKNQLEGNPYPVLLALRQGNAKVAHQLWRGKKHKRGYREESHVPESSSSPIGLMDKNLEKTFTEFINMAPKDADRYQLRDVCFVRNSTFVKADAPSQSRDERWKTVVSKFLAEKKYSANGASEILANIFSSDRFLKTRRLDDELSRAAMIPSQWIVKDLLKASNNNLAKNWKTSYFYPVSLYFNKLVMEDNMKEFHEVYNRMIKAEKDSGKNSRTIGPLYACTSWILDRVLEAIEAGDTKKIDHYRQMIEPAATAAVKFNRYGVNERYSMSVAVHALCYAYSDHPEKFAAYAAKIHKQNRKVKQRELLTCFFVFDPLLLATYKGKPFSHKDHEALQLKVFRQISKAILAGFMDSTHLYQTKGYKCLAHLKRRKLISKSVLDKILKELPAAKEIGTWNPKLIGDGSKKETKELILDVTKNIKSNGTYVITFHYQKGEFRLDINSVKILRDKTQLLGVDKHRGFAGITSRNSTYIIRIKDYQKGAKYHVNAQVFGDQGIDSHGAIKILKIK